MSQPSPDARAVVRAVEGLTTQVRRIADVLTTPLDDATTTPATTWTPGPVAVAEAVEWTRQAGKASATIEALTANAGCERHPNAGSIGPYCMACTIIPAPAADPSAYEERERTGRNAGLVLPEQAPAADEDALRSARRDSLLVLLSRVRRGRVAITPDEGALLQQHVEAEMQDADTARAVAAGNLRHVQTIVPDMDRLARENEQLRAGRETWKAKAEEIERDRDRIAAELEKLRTILEYEHKRANDAIDREETAEQAAEEQRRGAESAERELHTLRAGLRANGADPTQLQNLWAQISLRNRQWRDTKRELRVTRSMLEAEGGDVALVDEMLDTVGKAEDVAREQGAAIARVRQMADAWEQRLPETILTATAVEALRHALDGTEQPTTEGN